MCCCPELVDVSDEVRLGVLDEEDSEVESEEALPPPRPLGKNQVWPLTQFFMFPFGKKNH